MTRTELDMDTVRKLVDGDLPWNELASDLLPNPKDKDRFQKVRQAYEERVDWNDPILMPLNDHLFVVGTENGRKIKTACGEVLCDANANWKKSCQVRVREDEDELAELYGPEQTPAWSFQLREFMCPRCYELVEVESLPSAYPVVRRFKPDIDEFYEEWLDEPAPDADLAQ
jgi:acetone carboxylase gamma subunit